MQCSICSLPAKTACGNLCGTLYCGAACAQMDWHSQQHGLLCIAGQTKREREEVSEGPNVDELIITFKTVKRMNFTEANKKLLDSLEIKLISKMNAENVQAIVSALEQPKERLLRLAVQNKSYSAVEYLLSIGADVNTTWGDFNILRSAIHDEKEDIVALLLKHPNIDVKKAGIYSGYTPLMSAIHIENLNILKMLLQLPDINVNAKDNGEFTALMQFVLDESIEEVVLSLLLQYPKIDVNARNKQGETALMLAVTYTAEYENDNTVLMLTRHPTTDFFIQNNEGKIASDIAELPKFKLMIFAGIAMQKSVDSFGVLLPPDISTNNSLRRIRNHVCASMSDNGNVEDLKALAQVIGYPYVEGMSKRDLCLALSDVLALGNVYDKDKQQLYASRKQMRIQEMKRTLSVLDSFKLAAADYAGVDTNGKTLDQIVQEVNLFLS